MAQIINITAQLPPKKPFVYGAIKNNKWVRYENQIGIVTDLSEEGCTFNCVGEDGLTFLKVAADYTKMELAHYMQIPLCRRPSKEAAQELGYFTN